MLENRINENGDRGCHSFIDKHVHRIYFYHHKLESGKPTVNSAQNGNINSLLAVGWVMWLGSCS